MKNLKHSVIGMSFLIALLCLSGCSITERVEIEVTDENGHNVVFNCPKVGVGDFILGGWCYIIKKEA